jgi:hypothetical protein
MSTLFLKGELPFQLRTIDFLGSVLLRLVKIRGDIDVAWREFSRVQRVNWSVPSLDEVSVLASIVAEAQVVIGKCPKKYEYDFRTSAYLLGCSEVVYIRA